MSEKRKNEYYTGNAYVTSRGYGIVLKEGCLYLIEERAGAIITTNYRDRATEIARNAFYALAKLKLEDFRAMYYLLKESDPEYFKIADEVLTSIKAEYDFNR